MSNQTVENTGSNTQYVGGVMVEPGDWRQSGVAGPVADPNAELAGILAGTVTAPSTDLGVAFAAFLKCFDYVGGVKGGRDPVTGGIDILAQGSALHEFQRMNALVGYSTLNLDVFGDSIMADQIDSTPGQMQALSGGRVSIVSNSSISGANSTQILQRMRDVGFSATCDAVLFMAGANDAAQTVPVSTHVANVKAMIFLIRSFGKIPLIYKPSPTDLGYQTLLDKIAFADYYVAKTLKVWCLDAFQCISKASGGYTAGCTGDGLHPSEFGSSTAAMQINWDLISGQPVIYLPRSPSGVGLFANNATMLTDATADGIPDGWSNFSAGPTTFALSGATYPAIGNKCTVTTTSSVSRPGLYRDAAVLPSAGDRILITGFVRLVSASSNTQAVSVYVRESLTAGGNNDTTLFITNAVTSTPIYFEKEVTVRAGVNAVYLMLSVVSRADATAQASVFEFSGIDMYNLTTIGVL